MKLNPRLSVVLFLLLLNLSLSGLALGAELKYISIVESRDEQILFKESFLEKANFYLCQSQDLSCQNLGDKVPTEVSLALEDPSPQSDKIKNIKFDRTGATRILLSPNEKWLAYFVPSLAKKKNPREFVLLNLEATGAKRTTKLTSKVNYWDLLSEELRIFNFSPDSNYLAYLDDKDGYSTIYLVDLTKTSNLLPGKKIITKKYSVNDFLLWDKDTIYFVANRESSHSWSLYQYKWATGDLKKIAGDISYNQQMRRVGERGQEKLLFTQIINNSAIPVLYNPTTSTLEKFSALGPNPALSGYREKEIKLNAKLNGILMTPKELPATPRPLIIWLHGGPYRQSSYGYHSYLSYGAYDWILGELAKSGALVLKLDYRGSYGYGRAWAEASKGEVGKGDVTDVITARDELKKLYKINKTYVVGNSYGGYLALRTIVDPGAKNKFAGAMSIAGVTDWFVLLDKLENSIFNTQFDGLLDEKNSKLYYQADVAERVKNLTNEKIIIAHGTKDSTIPVSQADYLAKIFKLRGKTLDLVKYEGEDHVFRKKSSLEDMCQRLAKLTNLSASCQWP